VNGRDHAILIGDPNEGAGEEFTGYRWYDPGQRLDSTEPFIGR